MTHECTEDYHIGASGPGPRSWVVMGPRGIEDDGLTEAEAQRIARRLNEKAPPDCEFCGGLGCPRCDRST